MTLQRVPFLLPYKSFHQSIIHQTPDVLRWQRINFLFSSPPWFGWETRRRTESSYTYISSWLDNPSCAPSASGSSVDCSSGLRSCQVVKLTALGFWELVVLLRNMAVFLRMHYCYWGCKYQHCSPPEKEKTKWLTNTENLKCLCGNSIRQLSSMSHGGLIQQIFPKEEWNGCVYTERERNQAHTQRECR